MQVRTWDERYAWSHNLVHRRVSFSRLVGAPDDSESNYECSGSRQRAVPKEQALGSPRIHQMHVPSTSAAFGVRAALSVISS